MKKRISMLLCILTIIALIIPQTACSEKPNTYSKEGYYLDTICQITIYDMKDMSEENAGKAIDKAYKTCADYEALLSKTREGSDIYKINHANGAPVECSDQTIELLKIALNYCELSGGKFDITIGKVTDLWDFHSDEPKVPADADIKSALSDVNYKQIVIEGNTVTMTNPKGEIDLGAIAKGYISDRVVETLRAEGVTSAIVDLGGNICALGSKEEDKPFTIGIKDPQSNDGGVIGKIPLSDGTMVTSGTYERSFEVDGKVYHHILDVKTGYPVNSGVLSVTIIGGDGKSVNCDALSTMCLILGVGDGSKLIESQEGVAAIFVDTNGKITKTSGVKGFEKVD